MIFIAILLSFMFLRAVNIKFLYSLFLYSSEGYRSIYFLFFHGRFKQLKYWILKRSLSSTAQKCRNL